jgi:LysM repeat protein
MSIAAIVSASTLSFGSHALNNSASTLSPIKKQSSAVQLARSKSHSSAKSGKSKTDSLTPTTNIVTVQPGDYLEKVAGTNNTTTQRLYDANPSVSQPNLIYPGQQLRIPGPDEALAHRELPVVQPTPVAPVPAAVAAPVATPRTVTSSAPAVAGGSVWDRLAACESGGNWAINTGNGFFGGLQFTLSSWHAVGGSGYPNQASRDEQIARAQILQSRGGWGNWPACASKLGLL